MSHEHNSVLASVGARYLSLHRENYVEGNDVRPFLSSLAQEVSPQEVERLLFEADWRAKLVGIYIVIAQQASSFSKILADSLSDSTFRQVRRPLCIALAVLKDSVAAAGIERFLTGPYQNDSLHEYVAAIEALALITQSGVEHPEAPGILSALRREGFDETTLAASRQRFLKAVDYWRKKGHAE